MSRIDEKIVEAINELRKGDSATVTIHPECEELFSPICTVECTADWTGFNGEIFGGDSLLGALEAAVAKKHYRCRHPNSIPQNRQVLSNQISTAG